MGVRRHGRHGTGGSPSAAVSRCTQIRKWGAGAQRGDLTGLDAPSPPPRPCKRAAGQDPGPDCAGYASGELSLVVDGRGACRAVGWHGMAWDEGCICTATSLTPLAKKRGPASCNVGHSTSRPFATPVSRRRPWRRNRRRARHVRGKAVSLRARGMQRQCRFWSGGG